MLLIVILYAVLASTFVLAKQALSFGKPFFLIAVRMLCAGGLLLSYVRYARPLAWRLDRDDWMLFLRVSLFHIYFAFVPEFWALQYLPSAKTNLLYSSTPFIAAFLSYLLLGESLSKRKIMGMMLGFVGLLPVLLLQSGPQALAQLKGFSLPEIVLFGAISSAAYAWFLVKRLMDKGYALPMINGVAMLLGGSMALVTSLLVEGVQTSPVYNWPQFLFWVAALILVANVVVYNLYGLMIRRYSITLVALSGLLCPIFGAFFGWLWFNESITWHYGVSLGAVAVALYIFQTE